MLGHTKSTMALISVITIFGNVKFLCILWVLKCSYIVIKFLDNYKI